MCLCKIERLQKDNTGKLKLKTVGVRSHDGVILVGINSNATYFKYLQQIFPIPKSNSF